MTDPRERIARFSGSPYGIGLAAGRQMGSRLEAKFEYYLARRRDALDMDKLRRGALEWLRALPLRLYSEFEGLADGARLPLQRVAEWAYSEECEAPQCSGVVGVFNGRTWVARNNDTYVPEVWGYATIRAVADRIPTISFTMEGDVFTPTGVNREKLWLHYNYLAAWDAPTPGKPHLPGYAFMTEALERCRSLGDVEALLGEIDRDGGMLLFAVDGKTETSALFECACAQHFRRELAEGWMVGTNHFCAVPDPSLAEEESAASTLSRYERLEGLVQALYAAPGGPQLPGDLIRILADDAIERRGPDFATVYANVACPSAGEVWYTFGGYPAASAGNWQRLEWPWND